MGFSRNTFCRLYSCSYGAQVRKPNEFVKQNQQKSPVRFHLAFYLDAVCLVSAIRETTMAEMKEGERERDSRLDAQYCA
jgi:hypothetical protein